MQALTLTWGASWVICKQTTTAAKSHRHLRHFFRRQACMQAAHTSVLHYSCSKGYSHCREENCRAHVQVPTVTTAQVCCTALAPQLCFTRASMYSMTARAAQVRCRPADASLPNTSCRHSHRPFQLQAWSEAVDSWTCLQCSVYSLQM